jgi:hypothetical protein
MRGHCSLGPQRRAHDRLPVPPTGEMEYYEPELYRHCQFCSIIPWFLRILIERSVLLGHTTP